MSNTSSSSKVPIGLKIAFGAGMFANQMFPAILGIFMVVLVEDLKFTGLMWAMIYLFPRLFDAITDPIMGLGGNPASKELGERPSADQVKEEDLSWEDPGDPTPTNR